MKELYYLIPLFFVLLFVLPVFISVKASYNVLKNRGAMGIFLFGKKIKSLRFALNGSSIKIYEDGEVIEEEIEFNGEEAVLIEEIMKQIKKKVRIKSLQINYNIGLGDAFQTAMLCGAINFAVLTAFTRLKCGKPTVSLLICDNVAYNQTVFEFAISSKISISLIDLVYSFMNSVILTLRQKRTN